MGVIPAEAAANLREAETPVRIQSKIRSSRRLPLASITQHTRQFLIGTPVSVRATLVQGRIAVVNDNDEVIGYLPVEYNYIRRCIEQEFSYIGTVVFSATRPIPTVRVSLTAHK